MAAFVAATSMAGTGVRIPPSSLAPLAACDSGSDVIRPPDSRWIGKRLSQTRMATAGPFCDVVGTRADSRRACPAGIPPLPVHGGHAPSEVACTTVHHHGGL